MTSYSYVWSQYIILEEYNSFCHQKQWHSSWQGFFFKGIVSFRSGNIPQSLVSVLKGKVSRARAYLYLRKFIIFVVFFLYYWLVLYEYILYCEPARKLSKHDAIDLKKYTMLFCFLMKTELLCQLRNSVKICHQKLCSTNYWRLKT